MLESRWKSRSENQLRLRPLESTLGSRWAGIPNVVAKLLPNAVIGRLATLLTGPEQGREFCLLCDE